MNLKKKIIFCTILIFAICMMSGIVKAAPLAISASKKTVSIGEKITVNVSSDYTGKVNISSNGGMSSFSSDGYTNQVWVEKNSVSATATAQKAGTYTITATPTMLTNGTDDVEGNVKPQTITIEVVDPSANSNSNTKSTTTNNTNTNTTTKVATSNTTKSDTAQEPTFTASNKTEYATGDINVRSSYSSSSSAVGSLKKGDSVTIVGVGSNGWSKVTYNGKTAYIKSDLLTATKPQEEKDKEKNEEKSTNKALKSLDIESISLDPEFNKDTTSYTVTVGKDVEKLNINAVPENENAKVTITGNENLQIGENTVKISVTAEDGTVRTYTIIVKKQNEDTLGLASLKINGVSLKESFKTNVYEYSVNLKGNEDLSQLDIIAKANKEDATIEIIGNENLTIGENVITIMVKSKDGKENVTYQILVNKPEKTNDVVSSEDEYTNNNSKIFLYVAIGIFAVALLLIILIIVRSIKKSKEDDEEDDDAYGFKYNENNNIAEELYTIKNNDEFAEEETQMESTKTKLYDVEKEVDFSDDEERRPRRKGKHSK